MKRDAGSPEDGRSGRSATLFDAYRADAPGQATGAFTYRVVREAARTAGTAERRGDPRQRTRLRSGKVVDRDGRFLTECLISNRSAAGGRLRLPAPIGLPAAIHLFDDGTASLVPALVVWRQERDVGLKFLPLAATARTRAIADAMRRKYYAVTD